MLRAAAWYPPGCWEAPQVAQHLLKENFHLAPRSQDPNWSTRVSRRRGKTPIAFYPLRPLNASENEKCSPSQELSIEVRNSTVAPGVRVPRAFKVGSTFYV